jgi:hypothetical protein
MDIFLERTVKSLSRFILDEKRKKKASAHLVFWMKTGPKNYTTEETAALILHNFSTTTEQLSTHATASSNLSKRPNWITQLGRKNYPTKHLNWVEKDPTTNSIWIEEKLNLVKKKWPN